MINGPLIFQCPYGFPSGYRAGVECVATCWLALLPCMPLVLLLLPLICAVQR